MRTIAITILPLSLMACGQPYDPCQTVDDCDPEVTDACITRPGHSEGWCTVVCKTDKDCPEDGVCQDIGHASVCAAQPTPVR